MKIFRKMRQKLAAENNAAKFLRYAVGEILLVVIGILIALQINTWNEERKSANQENFYLNRLVSENKLDMITFSGFIGDLEKGNESIEQLSEALKSETISDSALIHCTNEYFKYGSIFPIFSSSNSTFEDLSSTGNLNIISNRNLRESIVQHYAKHKQTEERIQIAIEWALPLDAPFTVQNNIMKFEPSTAFLFPEESYAILAKELKENKMSYISNAAAHYWINNDAIIQLEELREQTTELISRLENEIKDIRK
ncbi:MAG: hypothetical protein C0591_00020 [Marinilabiliales bacterium]|nr:MAG: hypothetical protein C0591_00020 [Marinilabiliales bacterium]